MARLGKCDSCCVHQYVTDEDINFPLTSLLVAFAEDRSTFTFAVVISRKTVETAVYDLGYTIDKICYRYSESVFFPTELFEKWAFEYFFPEVRERRR